MKASKWLELPEKVVAISSPRIGLDLEKEITGGEMAVFADSSKSTGDRTAAAVVP